MATDEALGLANKPPVIVSSSQATGTFRILKGWGKGQNNRTAEVFQGQRSNIINLEHLGSFSYKKIIKLL